jgi:universal stress protein A
VECRLISVFLPAKNNKASAQRAGIIRAEGVRIIGESCMKNYQHILFASDGTAENEAAGEHAKKLAEVFTARISLLRVLDHLPFDEPVDRVPPEDADQVEWFKQDALESLCGFANRFDIPVAAVNVVVTELSPEHEIIRYARENDVDLIIVGARERHGLSLLRGATTDNVVHNAPCDVLIVHL